MRPIRKASAANADVIHNTLNCEPRVFLSYSHEDRDMAASLKQGLEYAGMKAFLAHEDIEPGEEWKKAILEELNSCDLFIPLITSRAASSPYVNQEIGFALARKVTILPFKIDTNPPGFVSEKQGMTPPMKKNWNGRTYVETIDYSKSAQIVAGKVASIPELAPRLRQSIINGLSDSKCFDETECRMKQLEKYADLSHAEINSIVAAAVKNGQVYNSFKAQAYMKRLVEKYRDDLPKSLLNQISTRYKTDE